MAHAEVVYYDFVQWVASNSKVPIKFSQFLQAHLLRLMTIYSLRNSGNISMYCKASTLRARGTQSAYTHRYRA